MKYCSNCGESLRDDAKFCTKCGEACFERVNEEIQTSSDTTTSMNSVKSNTSISKTANQNEQKKTTISPILAIIGAIVTLVIVFAGPSFFGGSMGISVNNVDKGSLVADSNTVYYETKCPKCGHLNITRSCTISKGEHFEGTDICGSCAYMFDFSIRR